MKKTLTVYLFLCVCLIKYKINALKLPGPRVYVITPSPRPLQIDEGRSAPFYYHNWKRRMDSPQNATTTTTTTKKPKVETPDLIFAEFESDNGDNMRKSLRKLLEKERVNIKTSTTTSTTRPIYVPDKEVNQVPYKGNYGLTFEKKHEEMKQNVSNDTINFEIYNNMYNNAPAPVYSPSTTPLTTTTIITTTTPAPINVENIWHIIDSEKHNQYSGKWEEETTSFNETEGETKTLIESEETYQNRDDADKIDENFALPGFGTNHGNGAENESRAIRTESNIRFPYVNLKPFQMKNLNKPVLNAFSSNKKANNMYTSLDNFQEIKNPVRGEAQDVVHARQPIDRYNPAQPYLPPTIYGSKSKQSNADTAPVKAVANLVPPPLPPPPKVTADDFPPPTSYESFPPYAPSISAPVPAPSPPAPSSFMFQPPADTSDDSDSGSPPDNTGYDGPQMDLGYRYKPPSPPAQQFVPTLPPLNKPFKGYTYDNPTMPGDASPPMLSDNKPDFGRYHYNKPEPPSQPEDHPPSFNYDHHSHSPSHQDSDYPELIYDKPHGALGDTGNMGDDTKGGDSMKGNDMGMVPPPLPPPDMKPDMDLSAPSTDDHGFPHDFPGDFKYHHDFDDHDFYPHHFHHHHHTTTTTTTTTEMPRVNRYSYYYLGKKLYYLPLYFSVYFIIYVGALVIKAVLRHKIVYPNSFRPNDTTASFFSKRSIATWDLSNENLHKVTDRVTRAIATAAEKYYKDESTKEK